MLCEMGLAYDVKILASPQPPASLSLQTLDTSGSQFHSGILNTTAHLSIPCPPGYLVFAGRSVGCCSES